MPGDQGQDRHQGEGGAEAEPEDHVGQVGPQPRGGCAPQPAPAGEVVWEAPGGHTSGLAETQRGVPEMVRMSQTILPDGSELSRARNLSLSLALSPSGF